MSVPQDPFRDTRIMGASGSSQQDLESVGAAGPWSFMDDHTATMAAGREAHRRRQQERWDREHLGGHIGGAVSARHEPVNWRKRFARVGRLGLFGVLLAGVIAFVPVERMLMWSAGALTGTSGYQLTDPAFYNQHLGDRLKLDVARNVSDAKPLLEVSKGSHPTAWTVASDTTRAQVRALWAAILQGYRPEFDANWKAAKIAAAMQTYLRSLNEQTKSPVPLNDIGFAGVAASGSRLDYSTLGGALVATGARHPEIALVRERAEVANGWRFKAAMALALAGDAFGAGREKLQQWMR